MPTEIITDQPIEHIYVATAGQDEFDFNFQIFNGAADLYVEVDDAPIGAYVITLNDNDPAEGGYITLDEPCVGGETVIVRRELDMERVTQFPNTGPVSMPTVNHELNRIVGLVQQISHEVDELSEEIGYSDERALDAVATALSAGAGIDIDYNDGDDIITIASTIDAEYIRDVVGATVQAGAGIEVFVDDDANIVTIQQTFGEGGTITSEDVRDVMGTALVAGAGISITVDDGADTITIANTSGAYTDEQARDAVGSAMSEGVGIDIVVSDVDNYIQINQITAKTLSYFIPASAMKPRATNGPEIGTIETGTFQMNFDTLLYDQAAVEAAQFIFRMPKQVDEAGNFTLAFGWTSTVASGNTHWQANYTLLRDNVALDTVEVSGASITDTHNGANKLNITARTAGFAMTGMQAEDLVLFSVYRVSNHVSDDLAGDAALLWMDIKVPIIGFDDA